MIDGASISRPLSRISSSIHLLLPTQDPIPLRPSHTDPHPSFPRLTFLMADQSTTFPTLLSGRITSERRRTRTWRVVRENQVSGNENRDEDGDGDHSLVRFRFRASSRRKVLWTWPISRDGHPQREIEATSFHDRFRPECKASV
jgi:hypothetical protein